MTLGSARKVGNRFGFSRSGGTRDQAGFVGDAGDSHVGEATDAEMDSFYDEIQRLISESKSGHLDERGDPSRFQGRWREILEGVNEMLDAILLPIGEGNRILRQIADGKIDELIVAQYQGDHERMKQAVNGVAETLGRFTEEVGRLIEDSKAGKLDERGRVDLFEGVYAEIMANLNTMLDAILLPIGEGNRILNQVAGGDASESITEKYQGDHERMKKAVNAIVEVFRKVADSAGRVATNAKQLTGNSEQMASDAEEVSCQAETVASATEEVDANMQTVAAAAQQLTNSIGEINRQVDRSLSVTEEAVTEAQATNATVEKLTDGAQRIGEVVTLIEDIAAQTNLLALNATIEAARAGDAGRGFAVVASEVKNLATQTAKATEDISSQIASMQQVTGNAVSAIDGIREKIGNINEIATAIAAAMEEQGAATQEIDRTMQQAAIGTGNAAQNIVGVGEAAKSTSKNAQQTMAAAQDLLTLAGELRALVTSDERGSAAV